MKTGFRLMGARHFIDLPKGTIYISFEPLDINKLKEVIIDFKDNKLDFDWQDAEIYYNNSGSWVFDCINYEDENSETLMDLVDINVVGDADPTKTLYLVFDDDYVPNEILDYKKRFMSSLDEFDIIDNKQDPNNDWARNELETTYKDNFFVNFYLEGENDGKKKENRVQINQSQE